VSSEVAAVGVFIAGSGGRGDRGGALVGKLYKEYL